MNDLIIPEIRYSDWSTALHDKVRAKRTPLSGSLELTFRCNNNCIHCYCNRPAYDKWEMAGEMDTGMITDVISEIADEGCLWLLLTGGEPLLRPDFNKIYLHAKNKGMLVTLFTNGTLVDRETADFLADWRPFSIEVTLYGATEKTYEGVTRIHGSYSRCMKGIELLLEQKLPLKLKTMAMRQNFHEIPLMKSYAEGVGLEFRFDPMINARLDMDKGPLAARLDPEDVVSLDREDEKRSEEWREFCKKKNIGHSDSDMLYSCSAGLNSFHIDPYGNLSLCIMARRDVYNLRVGRFRDGWYNFFGSLKERPLRQDNRCRKCELVSLCSQCPGWAQIENGDDESPVEYLCKIAHKRAEAFRIKSIQ